MIDQLQLRQHWQEPQKESDNNYHESPRVYSVKSESSPVLTFVLIICSDTSPDVWHFFLRCKITFVLSSSQRRPPQNLLPFLNCSGVCSYFAQLLQAFLPDCKLQCFCRILIAFSPNVSAQIRIHLPACTLLDGPRLIMWPNLVESIRWCDAEMLTMAFQWAQIVILS